MRDRQTTLKKRKDNEGNSPPTGASLFPSTAASRQPILDLQHTIGNQAVERLLADTTRPAQTPADSAATSVDMQPRAQSPRQAASRATRGRQLRFAFGLRSGNAVTGEALFNWALQGLAAGKTFDDLVSALRSSREFSGSFSARRRWVRFLRSWQPEITAMHDSQVRQKRALKIKAIEQEINRILFDERMQRYPGRVDVRKYPVLAYHAAAGAVGQRLLGYAEILIGFIPGIGQLAGIVEGITGRGILTGRKLSALERGLSAFGALFGRAIRAAANVVKATAKAAASVVVYVARKIRWAMKSVLRLITALEELPARTLQLIEEALKIVREGGELTKQHLNALRRALKAAEGAPAGPTTGRIGETAGAAGQGEKATRQGRPNDVEPLVGSTPQQKPWSKGASKLYRSRKFREAQAKWQPILDDINPCDGKHNCVPVTIATDLSLAEGKAFKAPVFLDPTGGRRIPTPKGGVWVTTYKEAGFRLSKLESYAGTNMKSGAESMWRELFQAGHGARAVVADTTIGHAYNVINWRGMVIALDGQKRSMAPFAPFLARLKSLGKDDHLLWHRTN